MRDLVTLPKAHLHFTGPMRVGTLAETADGASERERLGDLQGLCLERGLNADGK